MKNWKDLNGDGEIDGTEMMFTEEMLCTSREEASKNVSYE